MLLYGHHYILQFWSNTCIAILTFNQTKFYYELSDCTQKTQIILGNQYFSQLEKLSASWKYPIDVWSIYCLILDSKLWKIADKHILLVCFLIQFDAGIVPLYRRCGWLGWAAGRDGTSRPIYCCSSDLAWKIVSWIPQPNPGWGRTSRIHLLQWLILATQCTKPEIWMHRIVWECSISVNKIFAKIRNGGKYMV